MEKLANFCKGCGRELKEEERLLALCAICREAKAEKPIEKTIAGRTPILTSAFDNIPALASFFIGIMALLNYFFYNIITQQLKIGLHIIIDDTFLRFTTLLAGFVLGIIGLMPSKKNRTLSYFGILFTAVAFLLLTHPRS